MLIMLAKCSCSFSCIPLDKVSLPNDDNNDSLRYQGNRDISLIIHIKLLLSNTSLAFWIFDTNISNTAVAWLNKNGKINTNPDNTSTTSIKYANPIAKPLGIFFWKKSMIASIATAIINAVMIR